MLVDHFVPKRERPALNGPGLVNGAAVRRRVEERAEVLFETDLGPAELVREREPAAKRADRKLPLRGYRADVFIRDVDVGVLPTPRATFSALGALELEAAGAALLFSCGARQDEAS